MRVKISTYGLRPSRHEIGGSWPVFVSEIQFLKKRARMSELISPAPLYTKARVHNTKIGNILCTGKGCIGCDRKYHISEQDWLLEILGEVDSVDFNKQEPRFLSSDDVFPSREGKANGRHGNKASSRAMATKKKGKSRKGSKHGAERGNVTVNEDKSDAGVQKRNFKSGTRVIHHDKGINPRLEGNLKTTSKLRPRAQDKNKTVSFATPLTRQKTFTFGDESRKSDESKLILAERHEPKPALSAVDKFIRFHVRPGTYHFQTEQKTNFLKMLQTSRIGIFDADSMKNKKSSKWVKEALKSGAKEEDLFPRILNKTQKRSFKKHSVVKTRDKGDDENTREKLKISPRLNLEGPDFSRSGSNSILVIEHSHAKVNERDESLHQLGFKAQHGPRTKSFPKVSVLEIADSVHDMVQLGVVKLIHQDEERWYITVSSRIIRDFLIQRGITLRGRNFELIYCNGKL